MVTKLRTLLWNQAARPAPKVFGTFFSSLKTVVSLGGVDCKFQQFGKKLIFPMIFYSKCLVHSVEFNLLALFFGQILRFCCQRANKLCPSAIPQVLDSALSPGKSELRVPLSWTWNGPAIKTQLKNTAKNPWACLAISAPSSKACSFQRIEKKGKWREPVELST